jgi:nucleotide-binding universal stress UspA family protein
MLKILLPVDGSDSCERAAGYVIGLARTGVQLRVDVINVQIPVLSGHAKMFLSQDVLNDYYREEGEKALQKPLAKLKQAGVNAGDHLAVGHIAETIAQYAKQHSMDQIVMGTRGMGSISSMLLGSVATKVIHLAEVPVTLVK